MTALLGVKSDESNVKSNFSPLNYLLYCFVVFSVIAGVFHLTSEKYDKTYSKEIPLNEIEQFRCQVRDDSNLVEVSITDAFRPFSDEKAYVKTCVYMVGDTPSNTRDIVLASEIPNIDCQNVDGHANDIFMKAERRLKKNSLLNSCYWNKKDKLVEQSTQQKSESAEKTTVEHFEEMNVQPLPVPQPPDPSFLDE